MTSLYFTLWREDDVISNVILHMSNITFSDIAHWTQATSCDK